MYAVRCSVCNAWNVVSGIAWSVDDRRPLSLRLHGVHITIIYTAFWTLLILSNTLWSFQCGNFEHSYWF